MWAGLGTPLSLLKGPVAFFFSENTQEEQTPPASTENHLYWKPMVRKCGESSKPSLRVSMQKEATESRAPSTMGASVIDGGLLVQIPAQIIYWLDFRDLETRYHIIVSNMDITHIQESQLSQW